MVNAIVSLDAVEGHVQTVKIYIGVITNSLFISSLPLFQGDPVHGECQQCECDPYGSTTLQCHRQNGTCICKPGSGGPKCNECARGYTGQWPHCQACGECFDNWDSILQGLRFDLEKLVERALNIEDTGV